MTGYLTFLKDVNLNYYYYGDSIIAHINVAKHNPNNVYIIQINVLSLISLYA